MSTPAPSTTLGPDLTTEERTAAIREAFNQNRGQMTLLLARQLGVPEVEVIRALPDGLSTELDAARWEEIIRAFEALGNVHVIVSNGAATLEAFGQFGKFSNTDGFFNVQTKSLDMHIRSWELAAVFAVTKPGHTDGHKTISFQFFDRRGDAAFKVFLTFGGHDPSPELMNQFDELTNRFSRK
ncbi:MAG: ChuX/HutX family heme-like substrate-binding protein [Chloroflexota bacterium]